MPYGQVLINNALTILGILEQGGTPSNSDAADALVTLNSYWEAAGIDEGWIYAVQQQQFTWTATHASAGIGPTAASPFNVAVPSRIYNATFVLSTGVRVPLNIVPQDTTRPSRPRRRGARARRTITTTTSTLHSAPGRFTSTRRHHRLAQSLSWKTPRPSPTLRLPGSTCSRRASRMPSRRSSRGSSSPTMAPPSRSKRPK